MAESKRVEGSIVQEVGPVRLAKNLRMVQRAIREGWPVAQADKELAISDARRTLKDPESSRRERLEASKVLLAAEGQNMKVDDQAIKLLTDDGKPGTVNNTQNNTIDLSGLTVEQLRALAGHNADPDDE